jgi:Rad9-like protein
MCEMIPIGLGLQGINASTQFVLVMVEIRLRMGAVKTLGTIIKGLQRISSDVMIQCMATNVTLTCINASLTTLCHCVLSREAFESAMIIQDDSLLGLGHKVSSEVLLTCLSYVEAFACTLVFSPSMITLMYAMSPSQSIIAKMYYEQVKVVQALHPELHEYPLVMRTMAQPWIDCLNRAVGSAHEVTLSVGRGLVLLGLKGKSMQCKFGLPLIELYEMKGWMDAPVILPFFEFKSILSMAKCCNSLLTLYISRPGVPVVMTLPIQGIEECKFIIATLGPNQEEENDDFVVNDDGEEKGDAEWEYPASLSEDDKF